ncbi:alpha-amylase-like [Diorhabda carinulata]|uniref:alpha-amylase-like n=1 Tax=Diorhabda carinulata TaxID=1163345 RepID=UPI0025A1BE0B|nr:alpha-amylase-like [Diorhabda carinulata]
MIKLFIGDSILVVLIMTLNVYVVFIQIISINYALGQFDPHFTGNKNVIVNLFEWKWSDIAKECENFLQYNGYGAVQTSPPNENLILPNRPWYERYQPVSYILKTRSGNEDDFKDMTKRCNAVGVRIYADAVINHMAAADGVGTAGSISSSKAGHFTAVPYGPGDFHERCGINNYQDRENVRNCELNELRDLNHAKKYVREKICDYLNNLVDNGVAGFRIDAAKHMWPEDLYQIIQCVKNLSTAHGFKPNERPFVYQEVIDLGGESSKATDYTHIGAILEFKYCSKLSNIFKGNDKLTYLSGWGVPWGFLDKGIAVVFVDNHDKQREEGHLTYKNSKKYKMANAFMLAHPYGIPKVMSSYAFDNSFQGPPKDINHNLLSPITAKNTCGNGYICEHRWRQVYNMVKFKNLVGDSPITNWWSNGDQQIAFSRDKIGFVAFTNWGDLKAKLQTGLRKGKYCDVISGDVDNGKCTGKTVVVEQDGKADINLLANDEDGVLCIHINSRIS